MTKKHLYSALITLLAIFALSVIICFIDINTGSASSPSNYITQLRESFKRSSSSDTVYFRNEVADYFKKVSETLSSISASKGIQQPNISQNIGRINNISNRIRSSNNKNQLIMNSKEAISVTVGTLRDIKNTAGIQNPEIDMRLARIDRLNQTLNTQDTLNYKRKITGIIDQISSVIEMISAQ